MLPTDNYAVTAKRMTNKEAVDDFPTPHWATRALLAHVVTPFGTVWEPACGRGYMARALIDEGIDVAATDILQYGSPFQQGVADFTKCSITPTRVSWMITNPPFKQAEEFVHQSFRLGIENVAILVRTQFMEGVGRHKNLFSKNRPRIVAQFTERVPMVQGRLDPNASTATSYCWVVWIGPCSDKTELVWIPPCRKALERHNDYR